MRLIIAEKPSLGRAIAEALPRPHKKHEGYIETASGDCITWCVGHLLEQAEPDAYDAVYKQWHLEHLPIIPDEWQLKVRKGVSKQLVVIRKLLKTADVIVHGGDPDREGQLLVDEVLDYLKLSATRSRQVQRLLVNDLNQTAVQKALKRLKKNTDFVPLSVSALARSRADWLYGINLTRACTVLGQKAGYDGVLSVGRVQTPVLGLVVRRDKVIAQFQSRPYYEVWAELLTDQGERFKAKWQPSEACQPWMDDDGRVLDRRLAENVVSRIKGRPAEVTQVDNKKGREPPPLPYSLSALQIDAAKQLKMSAKEVLDVCQKLYEQKLVTYPRSDCRYLPEEHMGDAPEVLAAIRHNVNGLVAAVDQGDASLRSRAWNDKKVTAHHGIIPTSRRIDLQKIAQKEQKLYHLIARHYVAQFYPDHLYEKRKLTVTIESGQFVAGSRMTLKAGWKAIYPGKNNPVKKAANNTESEHETDDALSQVLPEVKKGQVLLCQNAEVREKQTQPPKPFTDATLLAAMTGIARFVQDQQLRKILKESDGLGTEATRAGIIELLFKRKYLLRQGQHIYSTDTGRALINALPEPMSQPDMTAQWEASLNEIVERKGSYREFMASLESQLRSLLDEALRLQLGSLSSLSEAVPSTSKKGSYTRRSRKKRLSGR